MAGQGVLEGAKDLDQAFRFRLQAAREDRNRQSSWINDIMRLGLPTYRRMGQTKTITSTISMTEQDDLFDATLQTVLEDFASDMMDTFTPRFDDWVEFEPAVDLTEGQRKAISGPLKQVQDSVFAEIGRSNYHEAAQECFSFWGVSAMAMAVSDMGPLAPIFCQPIELPDLLMERGADGSVTGKWREMVLDERQMNFMWPNLFDVPDRFRMPAKHIIVEGCDRDFTAPPGVERWVYRMIVDERLKWAKAYDGAGACPIITCRFRHRSDSAWGPGPAHKAVPMARVLDELAYLNLKGLQRSVDPVTSYEEDGIQNVDGGVEPGTWLPRASGSQPPEPLTPELRFDAMVFETQKLEDGIKKAMYQDRPDQPGKTPPTLGQWSDEKVWNTRRRELPRDRCVREWVMPVIERFMYIKQMRGELPPIKLGDRTIAIRPVSPLSKAQDMEDVQITGQVLQMAAQLGQVVQASPTIDPRGTLANIIAKAREKNIVLLTDDQIRQAAALAQNLQAGNQAGEAGALSTGGPTPAAGVPAQ